MAPLGDLPADRSALRLRRARGDVLQRRPALLPHQNPRKLIANYGIASFSDSSKPETGPLYF